LHGPKGGPLRCPLCIGKWNAQLGRKRRLGRIVIRAMKAYEAGGGAWSDFDKLKQSTLGKSLSGFMSADLYSEIFDPLGYMADIASTDGETIELTSELLADAIKLAHPDHHPPEREELARRTTQGLLALQPFVFPAPKPKPPQPSEREKDDPFENLRQRISERAETKKSAYPCADCRATIPYFYCDTCKAEWLKRLEQERQWQNTKQRKWYARRKARRYRSKVCEACGATFKVSGGLGNGKRKDARFCSDACRQKAHRKAVTAKSKPQAATLISRDTTARVAP
jgi:hypothetical protein